MILRQLGNAFFYEISCTDLQEAAGVIILAYGILNSDDTDLKIQRVIEEGYSKFVDIGLISLNKETNPLDIAFIKLPYVEALKVKKTEVNEELLQQKVIKALKQFKVFVNESKEPAIQLPKEIQLSMPFLMNYLKLSRNNIADLINL